jgi:hypothetical protein
VFAHRPGPPMGTALARPPTGHITSNCVGASPEEQGGARLWQLGRVVTDWSHKSRHRLLRSDTACDVTARIPGEMGAVAVIGDYQG